MPDPAYRTITYRLLPETSAKGRKLASIAGACRYVWNTLLDDQDALYHAARMCGAKPPLPTFYTLGKAFTDLRAVTPWLKEMPFAPVRYTLKHQQDVCWNSTSQQISWRSARLRDREISGQRLHQQVNASMPLDKPACGCVCRRSLEKQFSHAMDSCASAGGERCSASLGLCDRPVCAATH